LTHHPGKPVVSSQQAQDAPRGRSTARSRRLRYSRDDRPQTSARRPPPIAKHTKPNSARRERLPQPWRGAASQIIVPLTRRWGLTDRDAQVCAEMFLREDIGLTSIFQLGLFDEAHLVQLTKSLSLIGRNVIKAAWSDLKNARFSFRPAPGPVFSKPLPV
jgi:hypothetical protein